MSIPLRVTASVVLGGMYVSIMAAYTPVATLVQSKLAGEQFNSSDPGYLVFSYGNHLLLGTTFAITAIFVVLLVSIWIKPIKTLIRSIKTND